MNIDLKSYLKKPLFIALEGLDGVGKTTQAKLLCDALNAEGITTSITAEAKGTPIADVIRSEYLSGKRKVSNMVNALAFSADRYDRFTEEENGVIARLERGESIIADRWVLSSLVYSALGNRNVDVIMDRMKGINSEIVSTVCHRSFTIVLYLEYDKSDIDQFVGRTISRGNTEIYEATEHQIQLMELFNRAISKYYFNLELKHVTFEEIRITPSSTVEEIHEMIMAIVLHTILKKGYGII